MSTSLSVHLLYGAIYREEEIDTDLLPDREGGCTLCPTSDRGSTYVLFADSSDKQLVYAGNGIEILTDCLRLDSVRDAKEENQMDLRINAVQEKYNLKRVKPEWCITFDYS